MSLNEKDKITMIFGNLSYLKEDDHYFVDVIKSDKIFLKLLEKKLVDYDVEYINNNGVMQFYWYLGDLI